MSILRKAAQPFLAWRASQRGYEYLPTSNFSSGKVGSAKNPLQTFAETHKGNGFLKWEHYFDIYHRHFASFRNRDISILEIGVLKGGSLDLWRHYFGPEASLYGIDVDPACKRYETDGKKIFIGDQANRQFWHSFKQNVPALDIVIDDGGHLMEQQIVSLEELLPILRPGGIYLCEDINGNANRFSSYIYGLVSKLNECNDYQRHPANPLQHLIYGIHLYPYVAVIEKREHNISELASTAYGTKWD